ncbi:MAG: hypothetical protein U0350_20335 [Caldilineaceae bacterium]
MSTHKPTPIRYWISIILLLHLVAILLPTATVSAAAQAQADSCAGAGVQAAQVAAPHVPADQPVVIPKDLVDSSVFAASWGSSYKDADAIRNLIEAEFFLRLPNLNEEALGRIMDDFHRKAEQTIPPGGVPYGRYDEIVHSMLDIALQTPELRPLVPDVWKNLQSNPDRFPVSGIDSPTSVAESARRFDLGNRLIDLAPDLLRQLRDCAQQRPAVANVYDKENHSALNISIRDSATQIITENSNVTILNEIRNQIGPDGSINISLNDLKNLSTTEFGKIETSIQDMQQTLVEIDKNQTVLVDYIKDQQKRQQQQAVAAAEAAKYKLELQAAHSTISIVSTLAGFIDKKAGKDIAVVGESALKIADSMKGWLDAVAGLSALDKVTSLSTVVMTGNVLGAVMNVVGLFGDSGPTPDQQILEEIGKLRQDVSQLRTEMHDRFDRVDKELNTIYSTMQDRFNQIDLQLGKLNAKLDEIQRSLLDLDNKLSRIERDNFEFLDALGRRPLLEAINGGLGYQARTGQTMPFQPDFVNYENIFQTWGTVHAFDALATGPSQRDYSAGAVLGELNAFPMDTNINYLNGWLIANGYPGISNKRLASPRDWLFAVRAYNQLGVEWPQYMKQIDPQRQASLNAIGADLEDAMHNISTLSVVTGTVGNNPLFAQVIAYYQGKLGQMDSTVQAAETSFVQDQLKLDKKLNLYGGLDQPLDYQAPELSQMTCGGLDPALATPSSVKSQLPNFNRHNLAEYFGLGTLSACVFGKLLNPQRVCQPGKDACDTQGDMQVSISVRFHHNALNTDTTLNSQSMVFGSVLIKADDDATSYVIRNWDFYAAVFDSRATSDAPTPTQAAQRAALLAQITADLTPKFADYQQQWDKNVQDQLTGGVLHPAAIELAGSKALLNSFVNLGLPRAVDTDDFIHAMLYGDQSLMDDSQIVQSYAISANLSLTTTDILVNPRLVIGQAAQKRQQAFTTLINHYLDAITAKQYGEATDYLADARRALDLTARVVQVDGPTTPSGGNQIYLPLVKR